MGNENSTLGLSEEDRAELHASTERNSRIARELEEKQQRENASSEEAAVAQVAHKKAEQHADYNSDQLAAKGRIDAEEAAQRKAEFHKTAQAAAKKAVKQSDKDTGIQCPRGRTTEPYRAIATPDIKPVLSNDTVDLEDKMTNAMLTKQQQEDADAKRLAKQHAAEDDKRANMPSASCRSSDSELMETTTSRTGISTSIPLRSARPNDTIARAQEKPTPATEQRSASTFSSALAGWNARKEPLQPEKQRSSSDNFIDRSPKQAPMQPNSLIKPPPPSHKRLVPPGGLDIYRLPKIPKLSKDSVSSSTSPISPSQGVAFDDRLEDLGQVSDINGQRQPPDWYLKLNPSKSRDNKYGNVDVLLQRLKDQIGKFKKMGPTAAQAIKEQTLNELRATIHKVFFIEVTAQLLRDRRMLSNTDGLPQIFDSRYDENVTWPYDLKADAEELYNKWCSRTFEIDLMRGIIVGRPKSAKDAGSFDRIDPKFLRERSKYYGHGRLLNGQWWPTQLTALRDGAHGSSQGGIYGLPGKGAYSVIMSGGVDKAGEKYPDVDNGDTVLYCGTDNDGAEKKPSASTQYLIESYHMDPKQPIRLIRSSNADPAYAPELGFRYDGLYDVVGMERMDPRDSQRQRHRFTLKRRAGQDPIRGGSGPARRPTEQEVEAYKKVRAYGAQQQQWGS